MTVLSIEQREVRGRFFGGWLAATTLGWPLGSLAMFSLGWTLEGALLRLFGVSDTAYSTALAVITGLTFGLTGVVGGAIAGAFQWIVLRDYLARAGHWIAASAVGYSLGFGPGFAVAMALDHAMGGNFNDDSAVMPFVVGVFLAGTVIGVAQWCVLRHERRGAAWWILASTVAYPLLFALGTSLEGLGFEILSLGVVGLLLGTITGAAMMGILRQPVP